MENFDDDLDISWLTQVPRNEVNVYKSNEDSGIFSGNDYTGNLVSLEDGADEPVTHVLYENIVCQDISLDVEIEKM